MTKEAELKLVKKYPRLLAQYGGSEMETCMHWGFQHGDGWYELLDKLFGQLELLHDGLNADVVITSVKEKFGRLNIYYDYKYRSSNDVVDTDKANQVRDIVRSVISEAEQRSVAICEVTGKPARLMINPNGRWRTVCKEIADACEYKPLRA